MQVIGGNGKADIAVEAWTCAIRTSIQSPVFQLIDVGFHCIVIVLEPFEDRGRLDGVLLLVAPAFFWA